MTMPDEIYVAQIGGPRSLVSTYAEDVVEPAPYAHKYFHEALHTAKDTRIAELEAERDQLQKQHLVACEAFNAAMKDKRYLEAEVQRLRGAVDIIKELQKPLCMCFQGCPDCEINWDIKAQEFLEALTQGESDE